MSAPADVRVGSKRTSKRHAVSVRAVHMIFDRLIGQVEQHFGKVQQFKPDFVSFLLCEIDAGFGHPEKIERHVHWTMPCRPLP
jgi:hypothetical protein